MESKWDSQHGKKYFGNLEFAEEDVSPKESPSLTVLSRSYNLSCSA